LRVFRPSDKKATNPCPCGWHASGTRDCRCDDGALARYIGRISGPLLDRIDLHVDLRPVAWRDLDSAAGGESSGAVRARVTRERTIQGRRRTLTGCRSIAARPFPRLGHSHMKMRLESR
jgi:predicted ATPase with chaperone activity